MSEWKPVYRADNETTALDELAKLKERWNKKYPMVIGSWENNWPKLSTYFKYPAAIRKLIYTTNTIEGIIGKSERSPRIKAYSPATWLC